MRTKSVSILSEHELIDALTELARAWGAACEAGNVPQVNKLILRLSELRDEFKRRGSSTRLLVTPLLQSRDPGVRFQAGYELLALLPDRARAAIESIAEAGLYGLSLKAKMFLHAVDEDQYVPK